MNNVQKNVFVTIQLIVHRVLQELTKTILEDAHSALQLAYVITLNTVHHARQDIIFLIQANVKFALQHVNVITQHIVLLVLMITISTTQEDAQNVLKIVFVITLNTVHHANQEIIYMAQGIAMPAHLHVNVITQPIVHLVLMKTIISMILRDVQNVHLHAYVIISHTAHRVKQDITFLIRAIVKSVHQLVYATIQHTVHHALMITISTTQGDVQNALLYVFVMILSIVHLVFQATT